MSERRLGSTEIAAVSALYLPRLEAELPKNKTAGDVWLRLVHGLEVPRNARMTRGLNMEQWALDYYAEHIGEWWRPQPVGEFWTVPHPKHPDFTASPDAYDAPNGRLVIELKTQSEWARKQWGTPGTSEMANRYLYQCAWLLACCDKREAHVLCVFGNDVPTTARCETCRGVGGVARDEHVNADRCPDCNGFGDVTTSEFVVTEPAIYRVERDAEIESMLLALGERFLEEFVRPRVPPPVLPANNRRKAKELVDVEQGKGAAAEWYARCDERSAQRAAADAAADASGDEAA